MTHQSYGPWYLRRLPQPIVVAGRARLPGVRVRTLELRLIASVVTACWAVTAGLVFAGYRPGGPADLIVGLAALVPALIGVAGVVWPPVPRGDRAFAAMVCLAAGALLVLVPSIADVTGQLGAAGVQTLLPSVEAAYPWALGLFATCLFAGFGIARRRLGQAALRRRRIVRGLLIALTLALISGSVFAAAALGNELAVRDRLAASSRFGPTDPDIDPPDCDGPIAVGLSAHVAVHYDATMDGRSLGTFDVTGDRVRANVSWSSYAASSRQLGLGGVAVLGDRAWTRAATGRWSRVDPLIVNDATLDLRAYTVALTRDARITAESRGVGLIEGARARQCRIAIDGPTFRLAFPQLDALVGDASLAHWRGQLDYWIFVDGQIGRIEGSVNGDAADIQAGAIQATIHVALTATSRNRPITIPAPGG
jgi:hypothetical protein